MTATLEIERLGHRGDGVASGPVFVPYALAGERVTAEVSGERGRLLSVERPSPFRVEPVCPHFGTCGGCAVQHLAEAEYRAWKRGLVVDALDLAKVEADVLDLVDAQGHGRRRATLHARRGRIGFAMARSHDIVPIEVCPVLAPELLAALPALRAAEVALRRVGKPLDLVATATATGVDLDIRGSGRVPEAVRLDLVALAGRFDLARLSLHGEVVIERRAPIVRMAGVDLSPPPGAFLQATGAADTILSGLVVAGLAGRRRVADLFAGCGTFSLALSAEATVTAVDSDKAAIAALARAAGRSGRRPIKTEVRDLFRRPLGAVELKAFDGVVLDPPRAGAELQCRRIADSALRCVVSVSCNAATFARDAAILVEAGFRPGPVTPVDQFRFSPHVELVAAFTR